MALSALSQARKGHLAMLGFSALVAGSFSFGSLIANQIEPVALNAARFLIAGVMIGVAAAIGPGLRRADLRAPWRYLIVGAALAAYFVLMFEGLKTAAPVSTAAVFTLTPVMSAGFGWLILRQVTTPRMALALGVGGVGALWVIFRADLAAFLAFDVGRGEFLYFIGCVAHALYPVLVRSLNRGESGLVFTFWMMMAALVVMTVYGAGAIVATDWTALSPQVWLVIAYLAVFASAMTFVLIQYASMRLPAAKVMAYTYLVPTWVIGWEVVLRHGAPRALVLIGVAMIGVALWLLLKDEDLV